MAIKAIIFDCFGVLIIGGRQTMIRDYPDLYTDLHDLTVRSDYGFISRDEYNSSVSSLTGIPTDDIEKKYWARNVRNEPMFKWAKSLKDDGQYKIGLLSNIGPGWLEDLFPKNERAQYFDAEVLSGEVGLTKPDPKIFDLMAKRLGVDTSECVMIDDLLENVNAADSVGMKGIVYDSAATTSEELMRVIRENA